MVDSGATTSGDLVSRAYLFEVSTEVANKVGGIYQVLRSKVSSMLSRWDERYCLVGPWLPSSAAVEFEERPADGWMARVIERSRELGVVARHGRWMVTGRPRTVLLEPMIGPQELAEAKYFLWEQHGIDTSAGDGTVDEAVRFGIGVHRFMRAASEVEGGPERTLAHFHEWLGSVAIPLMRRDGLPIGTIFTTHATTLGRYIASNEGDFYERLPHMDHAFEAGQYNIRGPHAIERAAAHGSHVFTTVSHITGDECRHLLGREPDGYLPNGLNIDRFDVGADFQSVHQHWKERIHRFTMGHFFPSYSMDLDRTLYLFSSGRFEPRNKGFDLCLEALARLNALLKDFDLGVHVVFFIVTNRPARSLNPLALQSRGVLNELRDVCANISDAVEGSLFERAAAGEALELNSLVEEYWRLRYRRTQLALKADRLPLVTTHVLDDDARDPVLNHIRSLGLLNWREDPVKVVYHPEFIAPTNPLWGIEYEQFVRGCHLGVFPSVYEPWGYTPLECMALGVPSITSDLAGFGRYVGEQMPDHDKFGVNVLKRRGRSFDDAAADLARWLLAFCRLDRRGRIDLRNEVVRRALDFDWSRLGAAYMRAHTLATERIDAEVRERAGLPKRGTTSGPKDAGKRTGKKAGKKMGKRSGGDADMGTSKGTRA
ncbi:MAG: glycosyltransferase [Planctomycetota bacterium]